MLIALKNSIRRDTYKILTNITSWVMLLLIAGFVVRVISRHRILSQIGDPKIKWYLHNTHGIVPIKRKGNSAVHSSTSSSNSKEKSYWTRLDFHLIISNWKIASTATKTFWMPNSTHATQISPMADLQLAASTYPTTNNNVSVKLIRFNWHLWNTATELHGMQESRGFVLCNCPICNNYNKTPKKFLCTLWLLKRRV